MQIKAQQAPKKMALSYLVGHDEKDGRDDSGPGSGGGHETLFMADIMPSSRRAVTPGHTSPAEVTSKRKRAPSVSAMVSHSGPER